MNKEIEKKMLIYAVIALIVLVLVVGVPVINELL